MGVDQLDHPDLHHFAHLPWCRALVADPSYELCLTESRTPTASGENLFIAETMYSPSTVAGWVTLKKLRPASPAPSTSSQTSSTPTTTPPAYPRVPATLTLLSLGRSLSGHASLSHGGVTAALLDELAGILLAVNVDAENCVLHTDRGVDAYTAYLNIEYKKPMVVPAIVLGRAWFKKVEGRKRWIGVELGGGLGEGGEGLEPVFARGEALYIDHGGKAML